MIIVELLLQIIWLLKLEIHNSNKSYINPIEYILIIVTFPV